MDHVGILVSDFEGAKQFLAGALKLTLTRESNDPDRGIATAYFGCGSTEIELIELREVEARRLRLGAAVAKIEHIALEVDDLAVTLDELFNDGVQIAVGPLRRGGTLSVWTDPSSSGGVMYQFMQKGPTVNEER